MILFLIFWSLIYTIIFSVLIPLKRGNNIIYGDIISSFILGHYHLWYIFMISGLYFILPLLRLWINYRNLDYIKYFMILAFIFTFLIPQIINIGSNFFKIFNTLEKTLKFINMSYTGGYTLYFILGWYLRNYEIKHKRFVYSLGILSIVFEIIMTHGLSVYFNKPIQVYDNLSVNVLFQSIMVFVFIKSKYQNYKGDGLNIINVISRYSLGIYAIHAGIIDIFMLHFDLFKNYNAIVMILFLFFTSLIISLIIAISMSKVKILKKYVK